MYGDYGTTTSTVTSTDVKKKPRRAAVRREASITGLHEILETDLGQSVFENSKKERECLLLPYPELFSHM